MSYSQASLVGYAYRYGFNGKEKDDEISGAGNSVNFEFRSYDARIGRFKSCDRLESSYAWQSTYVFAANCPISLIDVLGLGPGGVDAESEEDLPKKLKNHTSAIGGTLTLDGDITDIDFYESECDAGSRVAKGGVKSFSINGGAGTYEPVKYTASFNNDGSFNGYRTSDGIIYTGFSNIGNGHYEDGVFELLGFPYVIENFLGTGSDSFLGAGKTFYDIETMETTQADFKYDPEMTALVKFGIAYGTFTMNKLVSSEALQKFAVGVGGGASMFITIESGVESTSVQQSSWYGTVAYNPLTGNSYAVPTGSKKESELMIVGNAEIIYRVLINGTVVSELPRSELELLGIDINPIDNNIFESGLPLKSVPPPTAPNSN